jgi:outer membrane protein assembly factor BamB/orotate phosphoribosyltransferase
MNSSAAHSKADPAPAPDAREELRRAIADIGVQRGRGRPVSPSGTPQAWLIDMRRVLLRPGCLQAIAQAFWSRFAGSEPFQIGGMEVAAVPLVVGLVRAAFDHGREVNGFLIRKERKPTGMGQAVEGELTDAPVVLVDDVLNSGASLEKARAVLAREGRRVREVFVVVDYRSRQGLAWRRQHDIAVTSLFTLADFGLSLEADAPPPPQAFKPRWQFRVPGASAFHVVPKSAPLLVEDRVYVGSDSAAFCAIDLATGRSHWIVKAEGAHRKGIWSTPAHHDGKLVFGAYNGNAYCVDARTGAEIWRSPLCEWIGSSPLIVPRHATAIIGLEYERPGQQGSMAALALATGEKVWEHPLRVYQHGSAAYWAAGDLAICGTNDHTILALAAASGEPAWEFPTRRSVKSAPCIDEARGLVVAASFDGNIYVLEAASGRPLAAFKTADICYTTPLVTHGRIFCGSGDRHLYVIDLAELRLIARIDCGARVYSSPRLVGGRVVFGTNGGVYRELDPVSLEVMGSLQLPDAITNAVAASADGRRIVVPTYMNELHCFERLPGAPEAAPAPAATAE